MTRFERRARAMIEAEGFTILSERRGRHLLLRCRHASGVSLLLVVPRTPSDHRSFANLRGVARREARRGCPCS